MLRDRSAAGGNVLTRRTLTAVRAAARGFDGPMVVYAARSAFRDATLKAEGLTFRQTPYDVTART